MELVRIAAGVSVFFGIAASSAAQVVSTTFLALTPLAVQMTSGTLTASATQPAGLLAPDGVLVASPVPGVSAMVGWGGAPAAGQVFLQNVLQSNVGGPPATGTAGPHEFLVAFTTSAPAPVSLELVRRSVVSPGEPWPTVAIDIGNDGTIDIADAQTHAVGPFTIGTQPLLLRVVLASRLQSTLANGVSGTTLEISLRPHNDVTILRNAIGCAPASLHHGLQVVETFVGTGVSATLEPAGDVRAFVFGLTQQPVLLPSVAGQPCLLVPSPDVVLLAPTNVLAVVPVALPAAVRPASFHVQAVGLSSFGVTTSDGFTVHAH